LGYNIKWNNSERIESMAFVYILECSDGSLYTGWTSNLEKRLERHNEGKASKYTRSKRPVVLKYFEVCEDKSEALKREAEIKKMKRAEKLSLLEKFKREG